MSDLIPTTEGVLSRFIGIEEAPVKPDLITLHLADFRAAQIRCLVNAVNDLLVSERSLNAFATGHYQTIPFCPPSISENDYVTGLFRLWDWYHESVVEEFKQVGWFVRFTPNMKQTGPSPYFLYAFALDPAFLPEVDQRNKR